MREQRAGITKLRASELALPSLRASTLDHAGSMPPHSAAAQRDLHAHNAMTANYSDQGVTGSAKAFRREVEAMRGPFSVALAGPKEGFSGRMSEIRGRRKGGKR